jgi:hypothetical protein
MLDFSDTKSDRTPDRTSVSPVNIRRRVRRPVGPCVLLMAVNQTIDSMQPPNIQILLIYTRKNLSMVWTEEDKALLLTNIKIVPAM